MSKNVIAIIILIVIVTSASALTLKSNGIKGDFSGRPTSTEQTNTATGKMWWGCIKEKQLPPPGEMEGNAAEPGEENKKPIIDLSGTVGLTGNSRGGGILNKDTSKKSSSSKIPDDQIPGGIKKQPGEKNKEYTNWNYDLPLCPEGYTPDYLKIKNNCSAFLKRVTSGSINLNDPAMQAKYKDMIVICRNQFNYIDWMDMLKNPPKESECKDLKKINDLLWKTSSYTAAAELNNIDTNILQKKLSKCQFLYGDKKYAKSLEEEKVYE